MCTSVGAIRGRAVVGRSERLGGEEPVRELQKLENQLGRAVTGNFRSTNLGVVMAESGLRPAESLLNNRSRRHVLRLMSLPKGNQAKSLPQLWGNGWSTSASTPDGWKRYSCRRTGQRNSAPTCISIADAEWAEQEARRTDSQPGLLLWTDGSRDENRALGYAVVWKKGRSWGREEGPHGILSGGIRRGVRRHCACLSGGSGRSKRHKLGRLRIFTDAQAAITRMTHDEPGLGQTNALQARKAIAALREREPSIEIEIRWCKGIPGGTRARTDGPSRQRTG